MKRVRLTSIPEVTRWEEKDFRDDGASFKFYLYKNKLPFTYTTWTDQIFLSIRFDYAGMDYEVYKNCPERNDWNGVDRETWDPEEFKKTLDTCYQFMVDNKREVV